MSGPRALGSVMDAHWTRVLTDQQVLVPGPGPLCPNHLEGERSSRPPPPQHVWRLPAHGPPEPCLCARGGGCWTPDSPLYCKSERPEGKGGRGAGKKVCVSVFASVRASLSLSLKFSGSDEICTAYLWFRWQAGHRQHFSTGVKCLGTERAWERFPGTRFNLISVFRPQESIFCRNMDLHNTRPASCFF